MHSLEFWWSQKYHQINGDPQFSWNDTSNVFQLPKLSALEYWGGWMAAILNLTSPGPQRSNPTSLLNRN